MDVSIPKVKCTSLHVYQETQASLKSQQPDATFDTVSKIVEAMWQALDDNQKEKYK